MLELHKSLVATIFAEKLHEKKKKNKIKKSPSHLQSPLIGTKKETNSSKHALNVKYIQFSL